jgi:hypothetical protein
MVANIQATLSLIDQGLNEQEFDASQGAELGDITDQLKLLLSSSTKAYEEFLDFAYGDADQSSKLVGLFEHNNQLIDELNVRVRQLTSPQEL